MFRIFLSTAIISLGIAGGFYFITGYHLPVVSQNPPAAITLNNNPVASQPLIESLSPNLNLTNNEEPQGPFSNKENNLTGEISKGLAQILVEQNPDGPITTANGQLGIKVPDPNLLAQALFEETAKKIGLDRMDFSISDADLKILNDNNPKNLENYIVSITKIFESGNQKQEAVSTDGDFLTPLLAAYQETANQLYQLAVPQAVAEFHKKLITALLTKKKALEAVQLYPDDAMAMLLARQFSDQAEQNLNSSFRELAAFFQKNNIAIPQ